MAKDTTLIDPLFHIPLGAEDEFEFSREYGDPDDEFNEEYGYVETDSDDNSEDELDVPTTFVVINQHMVRPAAGNDTVDVVAETDSIAGAVKYEIRVVKA